MTVKRKFSGHALRRMFERTNIKTRALGEKWINEVVPAGVGHIKHAGYTFVFAAVRPSGKQDLITMWKDEPCST